MLLSPLSHSLKEASVIKVFIYLFNFFPFLFLFIDIFLIVIFTFCVTGSIYWQLLTKLVTNANIKNQNGYLYGFGCMVSSSFINQQAQVKVCDNKSKNLSSPPSSDVTVDENKNKSDGINLLQNSSSTSISPNNNNIIRRTTIIRGSSSLSGYRSSMKLRGSKRWRVHSTTINTMVNGGGVGRKLYRCKHCQNYSTTRNKPGVCPGKRLKALNVTSVAGSKDNNVQ